MSQFDREGLISQSNFLFPTNTSGDITAADVRQFNNDLADSLALTGSNVISASYADNALSASHAIIADNAIEIFVSAKNTSGFDIPKGTAVHSSGVTGDKININTASYDDPTLMPAIGITQELISNNAVGDVILTGRIQGINTSNLTEGATVYVNGDGSLTSTKPTGSALIQNIGTCVKSNATEGEVLVLGSGRSNDLPNITNGYFWVGDSNGVAEAVPTSSISVDTSNFATTGSNVFNGGQTISGSVTVNDASTTAFKVQSGPTDLSPIIIEGGFNGVDKFTNSSITGVQDLQVQNLIANALTTSSLHIGEDASISNTVSIINKEEGAIGIGFSSTNSLGGYNVLDASKAGTTNIKGDSINLLGSGSSTRVDVTGTMDVSSAVSSSVLASDTIKANTAGEINVNSILNVNTEVVTPTLLVDTVQPNAGTKIQVDSSTEVTASATTEQPFAVWDKGYTDGGQPFPTFQVYDSNTRSAGGTAVEVAGGKFFAPGIEAEPLDASTQPLRITDAISPRIQVYSQNDAASSGTNVEITGNTTIGGVGTNVTIEAQQDGSGNSGSLEITGHAVSIASSQAIQFNSALTLNGATLINAGVYGNKDTLSGTSAGLGNNTDYFVVEPQAGGTLQINVNTLLGGSSRRVALTVYQAAPTTGSVQLVQTTGSPYTIFGPSGSYSGSYLTTSTTPGGVSYFELTNVDNALFISQFLPDVTEGTF